MDLLKLEIHQTPERTDELLERTKELLKDYSMRDIVLALMENCEHPRDAAIIVPAFAKIAVDFR